MIVKVVKGTSVGPTTYLSKGHVDELSAFPPGGMNNFAKFMIERNKIRQSNPQSKVWVVSTPIKPKC